MLPYQTVNDVKLTNLFSHKVSTWYWNRTWKRRKSEAGTTMLCHWVGDMFVKDTRDSTLTMLLKTAVCLKTPGSYSQIDNNNTIAKKIDKFQSQPKLGLSDFSTKCNTFLTHDLVSNKITILLSLWAQWIFWMSCGNWEKKVEIIPWLGTKLCRNIDEVDSSKLVLFRTASKIILRRFPFLNWIWEFRSFLDVDNLSVTDFNDDVHDLKYFCLIFHLARASPLCFDDDEMENIFVYLFHCSTQAELPLGHPMQNWWSRPESWVDQNRATACALSWHVRKVCSFFIHNMSTQASHIHQKLHILAFHVNFNHMNGTRFLGRARPKPYHYIYLSLTTLSIYPPHKLWTFSSSVGRQLKRDKGAWHHIFSVVWNVQYCLHLIVDFLHFILFNVRPPTTPTSTPLKPCRHHTSEFSTM